MATWSKKTYEMVAATLNKAGSPFRDSETIKLLAWEFAGKFEKDNRAFDKKRFFKNALGETGFTILETIVVISIMAVMAAIALPTFTNLMGRVEEGVSEQIVDAGNAALNLDFAKQIMEGAYTDPVPRRNRPGRRLKKRNVRALEAMMQTGIAYPPASSGCWSSGRRQPNPR